MPSVPPANLETEDSPDALELKGEPSVVELDLSADSEEVSKTANYSEEVTSPLRNAHGPV